MQFVYVIRKRIKLAPEKAIFIFVDEVKTPVTVQELVAAEKEVVELKAAVLALLDELDNVEFDSGNGRRRA